MNKGDACWSAGLMKGAATQDSITLLLHSHLRKPPALLQDSPSSTILGLVRYEGWYFAPFPLTPALSLGERVNRSLRGAQSTPVGFPLRNARCSLSPRERVRVRGK